MTLNTIFASPEASRISDFTVSVLSFLKFFSMRSFQICVCVCEYVLCNQLFLSRIRKLFLLFFFKLRKHQCEKQKHRIPMHSFWKFVLHFSTSPNIIDGYAYSVVRTVLVYIRIDSYLHLRRRARCMFFQRLLLDDSTDTKHTMCTIMWSVICLISRKGNCFEQVSNVSLF